MSVYRRPGSPFWYYDVPGAGGTRQRRSTKIRASPKNKREAEAVAAEALRKTAPEDNRVERTLAQALDDQVAKLRASGKPTWEHYAHLKGKILGTLPSSPGRFRLDGARHVSSIGQTDVRDLRNARAAEGNKPATIANELRFLRAALNTAKDDGYRPAAVAKWAVPKAPEKLRYLTREEADELLRRLHPDTPVRAGSLGKLVVPEGRTREDRQDTHDLALFLLGTGARADEANGLTWTALRLDTETPEAIIRGKGNKVRTVPLPAVVVAVLRRRQARPRGPYVFPGEGGRKRAGPSRAIARAMDEMGLNDPAVVAELGSASVHTLRHTFASWARQGGMDLGELQRLLGHSTLVMTMRYAKIRPEETSRRVVKVLDAVMPADVTPSRPL